MADQQALSVPEFEKLTKVSGLTEAQISTVVNDIYSVLSIGIAAWGGPSGAVVYSGATFVTGATLIPIPTITAGFLGTTLFACGLLATILALPMALAALGIPVAQAKEVVANRNIRNGFALGCVIGITGYGKPMLYDFKDRVRSPGFAPRYMAGVAQGAFNAGLALGYSAALRLKPNERRAYIEIMASMMSQEAKAEGRKLYVGAWSDRQLIFEYTRVFARL